MKSRNPIILCVDDEESYLNLLEKMLVPSGCEVVSATNGNDALRKIKSRTIDLVLLDISMPGMNGLDVCRQIKEDQNLGDIPIIMITGLDSHEDRIRGIEAGAEDYFSKPFHQKELLTRINLLLKIKKLNDERKQAEFQREAALAALQKSHDELDNQVRMRTADLAKANDMLQADIGERKRVEEVLESERTLLRSLIDNVPDRIYAKDSEGRFIICNEPMIRRMGKTSITEVVGKSDFDLLPLEMAQRFHADEQAIIRSGIPMINREEPLTADDGAIKRWNLATKVPLLDKQGNRIGIVGVGREITDLKQAEQKLKDTLERLRRAIGTTIQVMVSAVETRDPYTAGHQLRSADLARAIAGEMGLPQETIEGIRMAGSIHDIGKLSIPAEILSKPTKLSDIEFRLIKEHAQLGYEILKDVESPWPLAEIVHQHHERMDGSGYPRNLKGEEILIEARILSVADVVEAMASHRPYRPGLGIDMALAEIENNRGIFYDHAVVDACLRLFRERGFKLEST